MIKTNIFLEEAADMLSGMNAKWAFCGGFALDLFLGRETRPHDDIDICAFDHDRNAIKDYMLSLGWRVYEFRGNGMLCPLNAETDSESGRNLMCLRPNCALVEFYPCEVPGMVYYIFRHGTMEELSYIEFLFNRADETGFHLDKRLDLTRDTEKAILRNGKYSYIAPEIALAYKSLSADDPKSEQDFNAVYPALNDEQKNWLQSALYDGHPWKER